MDKKIVALALAIALCLSCTVALAAGSKTTNDIVSVPAVDEPVVIVAQPTDETKTILDEIAKLETSDTGVAEYFGLTADETTANLKVDELVPVVFLALDKGTISFTLSTAAAYTEADKPVVMIGVLVDGKIVWTALEYKIVDGELVVTVPETLLKTLTMGAANIAVLSAK